MTTPSPIYRLLFPALGAALLLLGSPTPSRAQNIAVMVNGEPITELDIQQRSKLDSLTMHKPPSRQDVLNELIDDKVKIKEGKKYGVDPGASDIDQSYASMATRMRLTPEQLTKSLEVKGVRPETLKSRIKADMVWSSLVRGRYSDRLRVGAKDVAAAVTAGGEKLQIEGVEYKMQPIVLIVPRGSSQSFVQTRLKEAEGYRGRVQSCDEANSLFRSTPNVAIRDSVTKTSANLPEALRKMLDGMPIGHLTPPEITAQGIEMVALCARKPTLIDTPKKAQIEEKMYSDKYEKISKTYLQEVRKAAMIEYR